MRNGITLAICTWNRCQLLEQTLSQLTNLVAPPGVVWDVLVVNNSCTDATSSVVERFKDRLPISEVVESRPGISHARNRALLAAESDLIVCLDDDVLVDPGLLEAYASAFERHPSGVVFGGSIEPWFPVSLQPELAEAFPTLANGFCGLDHGAAERLLGVGEDVYGANMAFRRSLLGGLRFDPNTGAHHKRVAVGEETEFLKRIRANGGVVVWVPAARLQHYVAPERMTLSYMLRYSSGVGRTIVRQDGVPAGPRFFNLPRWLIRRFIESYAKYGWNRVARRRTDAIRALADTRLCLGMMDECRRSGRSESA